MNSQKSQYDDAPPFLDYTAVRDSMSRRTSLLSRWSFVCASLSSLILLLDTAGGGLSTFPTAALALQAVLAGVAVIFGVVALARARRRDAVLALFGIAAGIGNLAYLVWLPRIIRN